MKFICSCDSIKQEIEYALNFSSQRNSLAITSHVLLENNNDMLTIKATDQKMGFVSSIPVQTIVPGKTTVFCDKLLAILKTLPSSDIEFSEEDKKLTIKPIDGTHINVNLKTTDYTKYPELIDVDESLYFSLTQKDFNDMVDKTSFAVSEDTTRFFLTGVYIEKKDGKLAMVATDGRRLAFCHRAFEQEIPDFIPVIIRTKVNYI